MDARLNVFENPTAGKFLTGVAHLAPGRGR